MAGLADREANFIPARRGAKLRSSCEGCGHARVKCDRGQPSCNRCVGQGVDCVYAISRKNGKPPRKRVCMHLDVPNNSPYKDCVTREIRSCNNPMIMASEPCLSVSKPAQRDFLGLMGDILPQTSVLDPTTLMANPVADTTRISKVVKDITDAAQLNNLDSIGQVPPIPSMINSTSSIYEQNKLSPRVAPAFTFEDWPQFDIGSPTAGFPYIASDKRPAASGLELANGESATSDTSESHSCPRGSYELFRDLICPSPFLHAPSSNSDTVSARLDEVLLFNSNAIDRLRQLLKCPCAKSGHRIMVHASIISRILIWYQQAAGCTSATSAESSQSPLASGASTLASADTASVSSQSLRPSAPSESANSDTEDLPNLVQCTGFAVVQVPISVGIFHVSDKSRKEAIQCQLVLSELKKAAKVIDLFTSEDHNDGMASLYSHVALWLRSELSNTVKMLRARLGALDKIMED